MWPTHTLCNCNRVKAPKRKVLTHWFHFPVCFEKSPQTPVVTRFENSVGWNQSSKEARFYFFSVPEKLTFGVMRGFHLAATILCFQNNLGCHGWRRHSETIFWSILMSWGAVVNLPPILQFLWCAQTLGLDCPGPSVTIKGCADPAPPHLSTAPRLLDLLFMGAKAQHHHHTLLCVWCLFEAGRGPQRTFQCFEV